MKTVHRVVKLYQSSWLKTHIDMKTDLKKKKRKMILKKIFFFVDNDAVFGKTMESLRKHRDTKLVATERRKNYLVSEPNCHTTKLFTYHLLAIQIKKLKYL